MDAFRLKAIYRWVEDDGNVLVCRWRVSEPHGRIMVRFVEMA